MLRIVGRIVNGGRSARPALRWSVCMVYAALVATVSLLPPSVLPNFTGCMVHADKLVHIVMYGGLSVVLHWVMMPNIGRGWPTVGIMLSCNLYGLALEGLQANLSSLGRTFSTGDLAANLAGSLAAALACLWLAHSSKGGQPVG